MLASRYSELGPTGLCVVHMCVGYCSLSSQQYKGYYYYVVKGYIYKAAVSILFQNSSYSYS